ncbi:demethylmenaquinone methyltransferase [Nonomuraea pusilla]|uniref:Demethylmenaquinone methyltransferase n=1 Tax=Nonomuraea pusilla TaxID=46177 RepID=A0A1H7R185_9ACTN|nr:demethylmenaquinone methyltransferase [Nonomuraea pusilla]SEL54051.1 demethylmenaquinone methyltransferase / 2-methoxy-6-polyprenyl-1,4-benzoquinol methylase [Nonomuraea pusilla]
MTRAQLDKKPAEVAAMFDRTARRYDLVNDVISLGQVRYWRRAVAAAVDAGPGELVLDLGAGTGTSTDSFTSLGARAIASDFSLGMLRTGVARHGGNALSGPGVPFVAGDAMRLPFADDSFDAVTISVALRNVHDTGRALREMLRVTRPGGRLVILEFSHVTYAPFDLVYREYLMRFLPKVAAVFGSNDDSYEYLAESIRDWPDQPTLAAMIREAGWERVAWRNLTLGIVAMHRGFKPA